MAAQAKASGGCLCGAVRYESSVAPSDASYCHCRMCQQSVGNAFAIYADFPTAAFRFVAGAPKVYRSSPFAERGFCADCGTPLTFQYVARPERISVTHGSLDDPAAYPPQRHEGVEGWLSWLKMNDGLPHETTEQDPEFQHLRAAAEATPSPGQEPGTKGRA